MPPNKNNKQKYSFQLQRDQGADLITNCNIWKHKIARIVDDLGEWREVKPKSRSNEKQSIMSCKALVCSETRNITYVQKRCSSVQFNSVAQSCLTLCNPMDSSTPLLDIWKKKGYDPKFWIKGLCTPTSFLSTLQSQATTSTKSQERQSLKRNEVGGALGSEEARGENLCPK